MNKIPEMDVLDDMTCNINFTEFHILGADEVEANLEGCLEVNKSRQTVGGACNSSFDDLPLALADTTDREDQKSRSFVGSPQIAVGSEVVCTLRDENADTLGVRKHAKHSIKIEFSCESEKLVENDFSGDYFIDNIGRKEVTDGCDWQQVEVCSTPEDPDKNVSLSAAQSIGEVLFADKHSSSENDFDTNNEENLELSSIMSDHNYTTQEQVSHGEILRRILTNHILGNSMVTRLNREISDFVAEIVEKINAFSLKRLRVEPNVRPSLDQLDDVCVDCDEGDLFVRNVMDAVLAEDAAEEEEEFNFINLKPIYNLEDKSAIQTVVGTTKFVDNAGSNKATVEEKAVKHEVNCLETTESTQNIVQQDSPMRCKNSELGDAHSTVATEPVKVGVMQNELDSSVRTFSPSPLETCSEPLEHTTFDEAFDLICNNKYSETHITNQLEELRLFAKTMHEDCASFASSTTNIRDKFRNYMRYQFEKFKGLLRLAISDLFVDSCLQTDHRDPGHKLRKLNRTNTIHLLESSESTGFLSDESVSETTVTARKKPRHETIDCNAISCFDGKEGNVATEYDDGVPLAKYTQSEIFDTEIFSNENSLSPKMLNESKSSSTDDELTSDTDVWSGKNMLSRVSAKNKVSQSESDKENSSSKVAKSGKAKGNGLSEADKEVERLINLNVLDKRTSYAGSMKSTDRAKVKMQLQKNKESLLNFSDDEFQKDFGSDESMSESDQEIMTEKQYLARYNENLKQQFLNGSSSDSAEGDEVSEDMDEALSDDGDCSKSPLVEKFLKKFNVESDEEIGQVKQGSPEPKVIGEQAIRETEKTKKNSPENSDCELLDDSFVSHKHTRPKSLEKMLLEVDKRKNNKVYDDFISLSSESESSDVEAVEEAKSRIIKPMLRQDQLAGGTLKAQKEESDRIRRLEKKHCTLTKVLKDRQDINKTHDLILDYNEETKTFIKVHPDIVKHLKQHQIDGVKFMYDSCYGSVNTLRKHPGSGCILAHCMGLGKTLQLIALLHTVISYKELRTTKVLVLCPKSTVMNWADEIKRWLGPLKTRNLKPYTFNDISDINDKIKVLRQWSSSTSNLTGILLIGYEAFRTLVCYHAYKNRTISTARLESIREDVDKYLLNPGADLVVCDEGHIIKNSKSAISLAVSQIKTPKRIILTGTPIQNNLKEYYSMVNFIKPLFLGTEKEFANLYANPIKNGQHKDSSKRDIKVMKQRSFVLHKKLSKFVQRKEAELLKSFLPQKYEYVLFIPMTSVQSNLYEHILETISKGGENRGKSLITDYTCLRKIWTHPKVLEDAWKNATAQKFKKDPRKNQAPHQVHSDDEQPDDVFDSQTGAMSVTNDWWRNLLTEKDLETILPSNKLRTMFEILRMCEEKGEKCLIFSAFVAVLNVVEYFFKKITDLDPETLQQLNISASYPAKKTWVLGKDYYRLDGRTPKLLRHKMVEQFNSTSNTRARVFLISARAGGQGINLIGANRVIILDTSWNPSNDQQNIFRIFRLGQKKKCYIYRLLAMGTMEEKVYSRSVTKQAMSFRVVDEQQIDRHYSMAELAELYTLTLPDYTSRPMPECPQDTILACLLLNYPHLVYKYHEHDSLLENKVEQELSEQEKADAWAAYERELQMNSVSEIREVPNMDDPQNNFLATQIPQYLGSSLSGFDMSSFLNYGNHLAPYLQSLIPPYNFPATNQQYYELYKRMAQSNFSYSDVNTPNSAFNAPAYVQSPTKSSSAASTLLSGLHGNGLHSNPLSALGDLSIYGLNASSNLPHSNSAASVPQRPHNAPMYASPPSANSSMHPNANLLLPSFGQYKQTPESSSLSSLYDYRNEFSTAASAMSKLKMQNAQMNQYKSPTQSSTAVNANYAVDKNGFPAFNMPTYKPVDQQLTKQSDTIEKNQSKESVTINAVKNSDTTLAPNKNFSTAPKRNVQMQQTASNSFHLAPPKVATIKALEKPSVPGVLLPEITSPKIHPNTQHGTSIFPTTSKSNNSGTGPSPQTTSVNMGIVYPSKNVVGKSGSEHLKTSGEMQIIPTTNPPGTGNISKQFSDISPSISLTALSSTSVVEKSVNLGQKGPFTQTTNKSKYSNSNSPSSINKTALPSEMSRSVSNVNKKAVIRSMKQIPSTTTGYTSASAIAKTAAAAAVAAKSSNLSVVPSKYHGGVSVADQKHLMPINATKRSAAKKITSAAELLNSSGRTFPSATSISQQSESSTKKALSRLASSTDFKSSPVAVSVSAAGASKQKSAALNVQTSTPAGANNFLNIRPVDNKGPSGTGVYIIEANINQKKIAVGAPTKSGGGTTITKVPLQRKRKVTESPSIGEPKRLK